MVIQLKELSERTTSDRLELVSRLAGVPPVPPQLTLAIEIQNKNLERTPWLFHGILFHNLIVKCQLEFICNWGSKCDVT